MFAASFMLLHPAASRAQDSRAVLLPESAAKQVKQLCSRESPKVDGAWTPSAAVLSTMESRIDKIANLKSKGGMVGIRIKDPRQAYRQYVGILIEDNATSTSMAFVRNAIPIGMKGSKTFVMEGVIGAFYITCKAASSLTLRRMALHNPFSCSATRTKGACSSKTGFSAVVGVSFRKCDFEELRLAMLRNMRKPARFIYR
jgi:hypothetical protein